MSKLMKISLLLLSAASLTACFDNKTDNKKVAAAIDKQNVILQQQLDLATQNKPSVSLIGVVKNLNTDAKAINTTVQIKIGPSFSAPVAVTNGSFQLDNLAPGSAYELVVHSTTGAFLDRAVFGETSATATGKVYQDLGVIEVAAGVEHSFKILDNLTNLPVTTLVLHASSNIGYGANNEQYFFKSTYDAATQTYKITTPDLVVGPVVASLDLDRDGKNEYVPADNTYNAFNSLFIGRDNLRNANTIYLTDLNVHEKIKVKITLLNAQMQNVVGAAPALNDSLNGNTAASYDATNNQYVVDALLNGSVDIYIPAVTIAGKKYKSSFVSISKASDFNYYIYTPSSSRTYSFAESSSKIFNLVVTLEESLPATTAFLVLPPFVADNTSTLKVFYSTPVQLKSDSVSLTKAAIKVTRGNESASDNVLPGNTLINTVEEPVDVDAALSLDGTLLSATPKAALTAGSYTYHVDTLFDLALKIDIDLSGDSLQLDVWSSDPFDINSLKLDNENFKTNDSAIIAQNTAGTTAPSWSFSSYTTSLYLPTSIENLKTLSLLGLSLTSDNVTGAYYDKINVVTNGVINSRAGKVQAVRTAANENISGSTNNVFRSLAIPDGQYYRLDVRSFYNVYLAGDNTASSVNSVTYKYFYETKAGVQGSGNITLPAL